MGRVVVSGMGKSGIIGTKIAATLNSTGTPAICMHPVEAIHGDLGMLTAHDVVVECLVGTESDDGRFEVFKSHAFESTGQDDQGRTRFELQLDPPGAGLYHYRVRIYPYHRLLSHPFECGLMRWL